MHVDLIGPYIKSIRQQQPGGTVIRKNSSITCMTMIDPATGWFNIFEIPMFDPDKVKIGNDENIDKPSASIIQLFNNKWLCRYPRPRKFVFDNGSEFKQDFTTFLKDFDIKHVLTSVKNPQPNSLVERVHKLILNMLVAKDPDNKVFNYIYP